jgi:hypothetical protein
MGAWNLLYSNTQPYLDILFDFFTVIGRHNTKTMSAKHATNADSGHHACGSDAFATFESSNYGFGPDR